MTVVPTELSFVNIDQGLSTHRQEALSEIITCCLLYSGYHWLRN